MISFTRTTKKISAGLALPVWLALTVAAPPASAANVKTGVNVVELAPVYLLVQTVAGSNYVGRITPKNCVAPATCDCSGYARNAETLRAWASMAEAALLSGKNLQIYYDVCGPENVITSVLIWKN
jgi:hypothetical protein